MPDKFPFKKAKLVHHNYDLSKRWYVDFHAWNVKDNKLQRMRLFEPLNRIRTVNGRIVAGEDLVRIVNGKLAAGQVFGKDESGDIVVHHPKKLTLITALDYVVEQKKANGHRENYYRSFSTAKTVLEDYLEHRKHPDFPLKDFSKADAQDLFAYVRDVRKISNKTINNFFKNLVTAFNFIESQTEKIWKVSPLAVIKALPVVTKKHAAYTDEQIQIIIKAIDHAAKTKPKHHRSGYKQLKLFIQFIYYSLARPNEIYQLRVRQVDVTDNRIFIHGKASKNKRADYVPINDNLMKAIKGSGVLSYDAEDFVFSKGGIPGPERLHDNFFWDKHKRILEETDLLKANPDFTLYSYKHSGAISLYRATKDLKLVQQQCRHKTSAETDIYLRDLGLMVNDEPVRKWKGAFG